MQQNKLLITIGTAIFLITVVGLAQKSSFKVKKPWDDVNIDSLVKITTEKNEKTITKRIGQLKHAEKAADSLSSVVTVLKKENEQLHEKIFNPDESDDADKYQLLPISKD